MSDPDIRLRSQLITQDNNPLLVQFLNVVLRESQRMATQAGLTRGEYIAVMCAVIATAAEDLEVRDAAAGIMETWAPRLRDSRFKVAYGVNDTIGHA